MANPFLVPLNALRAIEIVARHQSLGPAAQELGVTPGAVSQHIRRAEERLGVELFERTGDGLLPTAALREAMPQLSVGFQTLAEASRALRKGEDNVLTLTVANVFASRWLIWRQGKFTRAHPEIELRLVVTGRMLDLHRSDLDCGIRFGSGRWPGLRAQLLFETTVSPVCAPELARQLRVPSDLAEVPVIRDESTMLSWTEWFAASGLDAPPVLHGPNLTDSALAFDAAVSGQGVLLAVDMMSADAVRDGRLVRPFPVHCPSALGYFFAVAENRREPRTVKLFREWLVAEVEEALTAAQIS